MQVYPRLALTLTVHIIYPPLTFALTLTLTLALTLALTLTWGCQAQFGSLDRWPI